MAVEGVREWAKRHTMAVEGGREWAKSHTMAVEGGRKWAKSHTMVVEGGRKWAKSHTMAVEGDRKWATRPYLGGRGRLHCNGTEVPEEVGTHRGRSVNVCPGKDVCCRDDSGL
jgi:hypothetical protein